VNAGLASPANRLLRHLHQIRVARPDEGVVFGAWAPRSSQGGWRLTPRPSKLRACHTGLAKTYQPGHRAVVVAVSTRLASRPNWRLHHLHQICVARPDKGVVFGDWAPRSSQGAGDSPHALRSLGRATHMVAHNLSARRSHGCRCSEYPPGIALELVASSPLSNPCGTPC